MLLRLSYLALTNVFAFARLLRVSDVDKDVEILAQRHQLAVMQRQVDRALLRCGISGRAELGRGRRQIATRRRTAATRHGWVLDWENVVLVLPRMVHQHFSSSAARYRTSDNEL